MMSRVLKLRRGTTAQHTTFVGALGEITVDTTTDSLVVHDAVTAGGHRQASKAYVDSAIANVIVDGVTSNNDINITVNNDDSSSYVWNFGALGFITLPAGGAIAETVITSNPTIVIEPAGAESPNQALFIKGGIPPGDPIDYHLHLTTGALTDTSIIVGTDQHNIRTTIDGGIELNSYNYTTDVQRTLTFDSDGNLTLPAAGSITTPDDEFFSLRAKDANSLLRNEIKLDPNNGTYMSVWSGELETSFSTSDWSTASWENIEGAPGVSGAFFTNAENLQDFWTTGIGSFVNSVEVSINGGARLPVSYDGNNGETYGALLFVTGVPATSPTTITSLTFYYRTQNRIEMDYDDGEILIDGQSMSVKLQTTENLDLRSGQNLNLRSIGQYPVRIYTNNNTHMWEFDATGSLTLPREGKLYGIGDGGPAGDRYGYISWAGNSSGDGSGYNTMRLVPDMQGLEDADQYVILDPTAPGHIHIRAGGVQDNSAADLFLGGENSHVKISAGANPPVTVTANNNSWTFGTDGRTTFPVAPVPAHSYGAVGDVAGMLAFDATYIYYCTANYVNNITNIWKRTPHGADTW